MMPGRARAVLLADDNPALRAVLIRAIVQAGYPATGVADGVEAFEALGKDDGGKFGLLITDRIMPRLDGIGLILKLRFSRPALKIILISSEPLPAEFDREGRVEFMQKPFLPSELVEKTRELLG
jgi:CheY-like chemotaxis protein